jgi:hypothetical protein
MSEELPMAMRRYELCDAICKEAGFRRKVLHMPTLSKNELRKIYKALIELNGQGRKKT